MPKDPSRYVQDDLQSNIPVSDIISRIRNTSNGIFEQKTEATTSGMTEEKINGEGPDITSVTISISQTRKKTMKSSIRSRDLMMKM